ncbi:hypothetical protein SAMN05444921_1098 [Streptomyces wuyuanensis]|uniref:Uncharacterized protein n=1 Tax=Streptomyces wuyuanensis TaxID=1196353 RepID=A0A1G9TND6_9ACTN|nr:hypothetical protein SAMN05444921_1098 [Streptomyces wuyuanensis]
MLHLSAHVSPLPARCDAPRTLVHTDDSHHLEDLVDASDEYAPGPTGTEAFLYWEAHRRAACRRAAAFAGRVAGLSEAQRTEIEWWYVEEQLQLCRKMRRHITEHFTSIERHHARRYARLRRAAYAVTTLVGMVMAGVCGVLLLSGIG